MVKTCSRDTLADLLCLSGPRISQLVKEGIINRVERGRYPIVESIQAYVRYIRDGTGKDSTLADERRKEIESSRKLKDLRRQILEQKYVDVEIAAVLLERAIMPFRASLLALPTKAAPLLEQKPKAKIKEILTNLAHSELTELAELDASHFVDKFKAPSGRSAAAPNRKRVGGRKKKAQPRK